VVRRASRLAEPYVLADADRSLADAGDGAYFAVRHPRSVLCVPVIRRGTVVGAIYLENHTLRGAFSPDTIRTTELLASQVATSLETAELYGGLLKENARRRAGEAELTASRAQFEGVLEHMVDGVITCDRAGRVTFFNRAFESLTGFVRSDLGAATAESLASAIRLGATETSPFHERELPLYRALTGATCVDVPATLTHLRTGMHSDVRISSAPIIGANGVLTGAVSVLHDMTSAEQLELMKDQFIRIAAHELKTPVAILRLGAQRLMRAAATEEGRIHGTAELLGRASDRIHRIVDAIVLLSLLQKGRLELAHEDVELAALVSQVANDATQAHGRPIRLHTDPVLIRGDRERLKQVLFHLIDNAVRYSPGGEEIDVDVVRREREVLVNVRDHGVGIPRDKQPHIFERFFRAHTDTPLDFGGMGVGLYLSREIARQHGGNLWFESAEGLGSDFHLSVPLLRADEATAGHPMRAP
jgi:PAS domain S-box-containing protein